MFGQEPDDLERPRAVEPVFSSGGAMLRLPRASPTLDGTLLVLPPRGFWLACDSVQPQKCKYYFYLCFHPREIRVF